MSIQTGKNLKFQNGNYEPLGVSFDGKDSNFAVLNEGNLPVWLLLYRKESTKLFAKLLFSESSRVGNILSLRILNFDIRQYTYNFLIGEEGKETVYQDPYARVIYGREKFGIRKKMPVFEGEGRGNTLIRCGYAQLPEAPVNHTAMPYHEIIAYGVHVRGFSKKRNQKNILPAERGTFRALMKSVPYFQDLGVNYISLMPCYEFDELSQEQDVPVGSAVYLNPEEEKRVNYWGYGAGNYFALKAAYAATKDACGEFYAMVEAFHTAGIEVGMELFFPDYITPKFMEEVASFWVKYYGIDGFRVYCSQVGKKHLAAVPFLGRTKLIFEHWEASPRDNVQGEKKWKQIGVTNSSFLCRLRSFLKGDYRTTESAFYAMTANGQETSVVNYMACHDGFTLYDSLSYDYKHNEANGEENKDGSFENFSWNCGAEGSTRKRGIQNLRLKMLQNAFVLLLLSQGTPYIYGGDEFGNSQEGNNNAWCQDNETGWLSWKQPKCYEGLRPFVKKLIAFRKEHAMFHQEKPLRMLDTLSCGYPDVSCHGSQPWRMDFDNDRHGLGLLYSGDYVNQPGEAVYVVYNMYWEEQEFYLPRPEKNMEWHLVLDTQLSGGAAFVDTGEAIGKRITVSPRSIRVYKTHRRKKTEALEEVKESKETKGVRTN